ncbi:hypothetical protein DUNSADRAFT_14450 [Dunaliella salina]|uniref:Uncharacterized protein n=1 Tax=Dunaliella salina TaxID=3046 RepID=A0ABQ7H9K1_DUNSA|nr:hypothetical protein DUNSADRAFT_14450 [Dunaliella salina]|eukprot:KAF5843534.1 hypothetical protein DUNSADRAFT_14450 [Dunaliella salina]
MLSCFGGGEQPKAKGKAKPRKPPPNAPPADLSGQPHAAPAHSPPASKLATQPSLGSRESPSLLAPPTPPLTGVASTPSSAPTNALPAPTGPPPSVEHGLESKLLKATPWSTAVLTSDAKEVLLHRSGHEPAAALILDQALQPQNTVSPSSTPFAAAGGAPMGRPASQSFLHTLLGPYLEAQALATLETGRPWRTNVTKHVACGDLLSSPGMLGNSASSKGPSAELGGATSEGNPRAHRSWSVGASHISPAGAEQANFAGAGQSDPAGAVQGKEHRLPDSLTAAAAGPEEPRGWLSSGGSGTSGATTDVNAFLSGISPSNKAALAGVAVTPFAAAAEEATPEHPRPVSVPNQHPRDPIPNGMANGRHAGMEDCSLGRMRTSITSNHDQKPQHKSSAALAMSRSNSASNDSVSSGASYYTADPVAWEDEGCDHWDGEDRGPPAVKGREPQAWTYGSLGLSSKATLDSRPSLDCIAMDRQRSEDVGLLIGEVGENWRDQVAGQWGAAGTGAPALVPSPHWKRRSAKSSRTQLGDAAEPRGRSADLPGRKPVLGVAKSVPSANLARSSNPPRHKSQQLRGSLSCRNIRQDYLHMSDKALGQLRERSKTDDSTSKTLALLTSISQAQVPVATERQRRNSLYSRHSQSSPSQLSRRASQLHPPSSPGGSNPSCQIVSFANAAFHEPNTTAYTDQSGDSEGVTFQPTYSASNDARTSPSHAVQSLSNPQLDFNNKSQRNSRGHISAPSTTVEALTSAEQKESQHLYTPLTESTLSEAPKRAGQEGTVLHKPQGARPSAL